uniref:DNA-directed RNA polymerase III subunit RPC3 n=1 Tax=Oncorhynchus kisutch TaxID=8019 RepID=A0A8C7CAZ6_ONCKI
MTAQEVRLCGLLLQEHFGEDRHSPAQRRGTEPQDHRPGSPVEYRASCERVLSVLRYPQYIYTAKTLYGDTGELLIVEEVLQRGHMTLSNTVKTVADRLTHNMEGNDLCLLSPPSLSFQSCGDEGIYWLVNFERFHQHFRVQASKLDQTSSEIVRTMLRMSEVTTTQTAADTQPLSANEIFRSLPPNYSISRPILGQYLSLLVDDPMEFVGKSGDSGGGMYLVNLQRALANLARATLESVVQERFGLRSARIFRLLLRKRHLEQKQVEDFAMILAKEAKDMLYTLLSENLVQLQEIPKTPDHAPSRTFYLYTVNQLPTARLLLQVANLIERRLFETKENKRLLEKSQRIEAILASLQASGAEPEQLTEVEEMITAPERQQLEALRHHINKYSKRQYIYFLEYISCNSTHFAIRWREMFSVFNMLSE